MGIPGTGRVQRLEREGFFFFLDLDFFLAMKKTLAVHSHLPACSIIMLLLLPFDHNMI